MSDFCTTILCRTSYYRYIAQQLMKFSIVSKLSAKRFAEFYSDWPKLLLGPMPLVEAI